MITLRPLESRLFTFHCSRHASRFLAVALLASLTLWSSISLGQDTDSEPPKAEQTAPKAEESAAKPGESAAKTEEAAEPAGPITALVHGRIMTMTDAGEIEDGTVLIQDGKIKSVGSDLEVPEGATIVDVAGMIVTPGLVDLRSKLWMTPSAAADTGSTAALDALDGVDAYSEDWKEVARQGITSVYVQPSARGSLGGYGALLRVAAGGDDLEKLTLIEHAGFQSSLGVGTSNSSTKSKNSEFSGLKKRFSDAKAYAEEWKKYREYEEAEAKRKAQQKKPDADKDKESADKSKTEEASKESAPQGMRRGFGGSRPFPGGRPMPPGVNPPAGKDQPAEGDKDKEKPEEKKDADKESGKEGESKAGESKEEEKKPPKKPDQDPLKDRIVEVLEGKVPLRMEVHGLDDAKRALEFAKEFEITVVLEGLSDLATSKQAIKDSSLPLVLGPWLDAEQESYQAKDRVELWGECFKDYEGRLVIASFARSARGSKQLRYHAAAAVAAGFEPQRVLESITANAALLAGAGDSRGRIKEGYAADLAVFAGHPLDPSAPVSMTMSAGEVTYQAAETPVAVAPDTLVTDVEFPESLPGEYVLKSQRILNTEGVFEPGQIHVADGLIKSVQPIDAEITGVRIIDVGNAVITPGLVTAHAELALASLVDRQGLADSGPVRAADVYDALLPSVRRLVDGGFLRAASAPASDRVIAGQAAELRLLAKEPVINAELAEKVVLSDSARSRERFPSSLAGQQQLVRDAFSGKVEPSPLYLPAAALAVFDEAKAERQKAIVEGQRPVMLLADSDAEVMAAAKLIREMKINGIVAGADQWESLAEAMKDQDGEAKKLACIIWPMESAAYDWYAMDVVALVSAGSPIAFAGEEPFAIRKTAAAIVQAGMPADAALRALTVDAATLLGMSEGAGRFVSGTPADYVVWNGSPVNLSAEPLAIVIDGTLVDEKSK